MLMSQNVTKLVNEFLIHLITDFNFIEEKSENITMHKHNISYCLLSVNVNGNFIHNVLAKN